MSVRVVDHFKTGVRACWITTYNLDLGLFDGFLFNRLGDPPLNVTVLTDGHQHDKVLDSLTVQEPWRIDRVNRRWLLRPVHHLPTFHPKTLLFVEASTTTLLVGSGNLSYSGIDAGHEVFTTFTSDSEQGLAAISGWVSWMSLLLERLDDPLLRRRFADLRRQLPTLPAPGGGFLHNLTEPLLQQLIRAAPPAPRTLLLTAPFFDPGLHAVDQLRRHLAPERIVLHLAERSKIDGGRLSALADTFDGDLELRRYDQAPFVHAKLAGVIGGHGHGVLLSGSANLSSAALERAADGAPPGNIEIAALAALDGEQIEAAFTDPGRLESSEVSLEVFADHEADYDDPEVRTPAVRLLSAIRGDDGSITFQIPGDTGCPVELEPTHPALTEAEVTDGTTTAALHDTAQLTGRLVWLQEGGEPLSNRVVVTEPTELERHLTARTDQSRQRPSELHLHDVSTPLGAVLTMLHQNYVMDVTETEAVASAERAAESEGASSDADSELWDRLARDTLAYDPRTTNYRASHSAHGDDTPLLQLLAAMLARSPDEVRTRFDNVLAFPLMPPADDGTAADEGSTAATWSDATRIRVRARNVLRRWADAIGDDRLLWLDPAAPAINYRVMIDALAVLTSINRGPTSCGLTDDDLNDLVERTTTAMVGIWPALDADALSSIDAHTVAATTALVTMALQHGPDRRARILRWQPLLLQLRQQCLIDATDKAALYLSVVFEHDTSRDDLERALQYAADFLDDEEWIRRIQQRLELTEVRFDRPAHGQDLDILLHLHGIDRPLADPRTLQLIDAIRTYRNASRIALHSGSGNWRLVIVPNDYSTLKAPWLHDDDGYVESLEVVTNSRLDELITTGSTLSELFLPEHRAA